MTFRWLAGFAVHLAVAGPAVCQTSERDELTEPFCYFSHPTDQLGFENSPNATVVTSDGAFLTPYGQLAFFTEDSGRRTPILQRVKTLLNGYLPVIEFQFERNGVRYQFEAFATPTDLDPQENLVTFIRCQVTNLTRRTFRGCLDAEFLPITSTANADGWSGFLAQRQGLMNALEVQRSTTWHSSRYMEPSKFDIEHNASHTEGDLAVVSRHAVFETDRGDIGKQDVGSLPGRFTLGPMAHRRFTFKLPSVPIELTRKTALQQFKSADYADYRAKTIRYWKGRIAQAATFEVDDPKVENTFKTSLINDLIGREVSQDGTVYQRVNRIHYNYMWIRDSTFFVRTYDMLGLTKLADETLKPFFVWKDGKPVSFFQPGSAQPDGARLSVQEDYWGQVLWAVGAHFRTTGDLLFLQSFYPLLAPHIQKFVAACKADPKGLWPVAGPYDNEAINGHYTGHSFWAILGLRYAVLMAHAMGRQEDAMNWQAILDSYQTNFLTQLGQLSQSSDGYIPPGMDDVHAGNDWDNASGGIYPFEVLSTGSAMARKTLTTVRDNNYQEGIMTYGGNALVAKELKKRGETIPGVTMHHYETFYVTESNTVLGEQKKVIEDLYSILVHTGSTNSGFEFCIPPWTTRDPGDNFTPHGWFAARFMSQIRDLLVREERNDLHLLSALAPEWVQPGKEVRVTNAPTFFGTTSYRLNCRADGATMTLANKWKVHGQPAAIVVHVPWFLQIKSVKVDGVPEGLKMGDLKLPTATKKLEVEWTWKEHPNLSYQEAVKLYLDKYYGPRPVKDPEFLFPN